MDLRVSRVRGGWEVIRNQRLFLSLFPEPCGLSDLPSLFSLSLSRICYEYVSSCSFNVHHTLTILEVTWSRALFHKFLSSAHRLLGSYCEVQGHRVHKDTDPHGPTPSFHFSREIIGLVPGLG